MDSMDRMLELIMHPHPPLITHHSSFIILPLSPSPPLPLPDARQKFSFTGNTRHPIMRMPELRNKKQMGPAKEDRISEPSGNPPAVPLRHEMEKHLWWSSSEKRKIEGEPGIE